MSANIEMTINSTPANVARYEQNHHLAPTDRRNALIKEIALACLCLIGIAIATAGLNVGLEGFSATAHAHGIADFVTPALVGMSRILSIPVLCFSGLGIAIGVLCFVVQLVQIYTVWQEKHFEDTSIAEQTCREIASATTFEAIYQQSYTLARYGFISEDTLTRLEDFSIQQDTLKRRELSHPTSNDALSRLLRTDRAALDSRWDRLKSDLVSELPYVPQNGQMAASRSIAV